ncbi:MAG: TetR/AcrR family transcriptional regulator [Sedimentisphaerales bacterium]
MADLKLTRKEKEKRMHKDEILEAAMNLFSAKGFHNVSMQDIASESQFAVGTLYNFFQSKEQLFGELLNECGEKIYHTIWPILTNEQLREDEKLRSLVRAYNKLAEENIEFIRLYVSGYGTLTLLLPRNEQAEKIKKILDAKIEEVIESGIRNKIFRPIDPQIAMLSLVSTIRTFIFESSADFDKAKVEQGLKKIENLFLDILLLPENQNG